MYNNYWGQNYKIYAQYLQYRSDKTKQVGSGNPICINVALPIQPAKYSYAEDV